LLKIEIGLLTMLRDTLLTKELLGGIVSILALPQVSDSSVGGVWQLSKDDWQPAKGLI